ncbi:MAG: Lipid II flippase MurJ [Anaerolineales bacterium]|nr:Lipid II flippase MurJ [Anaerolineales bacterium]
MSTDVTRVEPAPAEVQGPGIARSAAIVSAGNLASRALGLVREQVIAYLFGAGPLVSAFVVASQVPTLIYDLLIGGLLSSALVPVFSDYAAPERRRELWRLASIVFSLVASVMAIFVLAIEIGAPWVALAMGAGASPDAPNTLAATTRMIRVMVPALLFFGLSGASTGLLYTLKRFRFPAFGAAAFNATVITVGTLLAKPFGIYSLAGGILIGAGMQLAIQLPDLPWRRLRFEIDLSHPGLRRIGRLYLPILLGLVVSNIGVIIDRNFAFRTGAGSIAWMRYATTLIQAPLGLVSVAVSLAALPSLSQRHVAGDLAGFRRTLARGLRMILVLIIPATIGLFVLATPVIQLLFEHGEFTAFDTRQTSNALRLYLLGLPGAAIDWPLIFAFYARKDTLTPALVGVAAVLIYLAIAPTLAFVAGMGFLGLVAANSVQLTSHAVIMLILLHRRIDGVRGSRLPETVVKSSTAALAMGGVVWVVADQLPSLIELPGAAGTLTIVGSAAAVGLTVYGLLAALLRLEEIHLVWARLRQKVSTMV